MNGRPSPDLVGHKFGMLTVVSRAPNRGTKSAWNCKCSCGQRLEVRADNLRGGYQISCGCTRSGKVRPTHKKKLSVVFRDPRDVDQSYRKPQYSEAAALDLAAALGPVGRK